MRVGRGLANRVIPVVVADACGGRDRPAMQRTLDGFRFSGDALLTDTGTIMPLLARGALSRAGSV